MYLEIAKKSEEKIVDFCRNLLILLLCDEKKIRKLNRTYKKEDEEVPIYLLSVCCLDALHSYDKSTIGSLIFVVSGFALGKYRTT